MVLVVVMVGISWPMYRGRVVGGFCPCFADVFLGLAKYV